MSSIIKIVYLLVLSTFFGSSVQCFFNPFDYFSRAPAQVQPQPQPQPQPITFEVPKNSVGDLTKMLQTNPDILREAIAKSQNPNGLQQPIALSPQGNQLKYGPSNIEPVSRSYVTTRGLPSETYINGQRFVLTSRLGILKNRLTGYPASLSPTSYSPYMLTYTTNKPNTQSKPEESESYSTEETVESEENNKKQPPKNRNTNEDKRKGKEENDNKNKDSNSVSESGSNQSAEKDDKAKNEKVKNGNKKNDDANKRSSGSWEYVSGSSEGENE